MNGKESDRILEEYALRKYLTADTSIDLIRDLNFPEQDKFVLDQSRFVAACCTRRAGKSHGMGLRFARTMKTHPGCLCPYTALTRDSAKNIMWNVLQEQDEKYKWHAKFTESNLTMTFPNNSKLQLFGADMKNFIKRLKGPKYPGVGIDEAQDFGSHLASLVDDVFTPAISDYSDSWIGLTGTPGPVPHGYFYEVTELKQHGYSNHSWSLFNNPYLPNARKFVEELKIRKKWSDDNPTLLREWYGKWVLDLDALVFKYEKKRNHYQDLPKGKWEYVIGVDIGHDDADAIAVIGWNSSSDECYLVEEFVKAGQGITELARQIEDRIKKYDPVSVVMDTGGLGKKIAVEMQKRYSLPIEAAEKDRKFEYIEILNDALKTGKFFAKEGSQFAEDAARVKWDQDSLKLKISDSFHSDICDAVLYGFRQALHWLYEPEQARGPKPGTEAFARAEEERLEAGIDEAYQKNKQKDKDPMEEAFWSDKWD